MADRVLWFFAQSLAELVLRKIVTRLFEQQLGSPNLRGHFLMFR